VAEAVEETVEEAPVKEAADASLSLSMVVTPVRRSARLHAVNLLGNN
jgi:hypothetical protein